MSGSKKYDGVELTILTFAGQTYQPALETFANEFKALTGATIKNRPLPDPYGWWAMVPLAQADAVSETPQFDMFSDDSQHTYRLAPHLRPLDDLIERFDYDMNDFFLPVYRDGDAIEKGVRYGLPIRVRVPMVFYRKDLFGDLPSTWSEYEKRLAATTGGEMHGLSVAGFGYPYHPFGEAYELTKAFLCRNWSLGGELVSSAGEPLIQGECGVEALEMLKRQVTSYAPPESVRWDEKTATKAFLDGKTAAIECVPHYLLPHLQNPEKSKIVDKWGVGPHPGGHGAYFTMHEMVVFKHCKHPEAAFEFIAYCTNRSNAQRLCAEYSETAARKQPWLDHQLEPTTKDLSPIVDALDRGITFARGLPPWLEMLSTLWETVGYHMKGYLTATESLNLAATRWRRLLDNK